MSDIKTETIRRRDLTGDDVTISDGWHIVNGCDILVEDGCVLRGTKDEGSLPAGVYVSVTDGWLNCHGEDAVVFCRGLFKGTRAVM